MPRESMPVKAFGRAVLGYQKVSQRKSFIFHQFHKDEEIQQEALELEDALEKALLANEENGFRRVSVEIPEALNTAFQFGHISTTGEDVFKEFRTRVFHTLGVPLHYHTHDYKERTLTVKVF